MVAVVYGDGTGGMRKWNGMGWIGLKLLMLCEGTRGRFVFEGGERVIKEALAVWWGAGGWLEAE
jgi:hypothetical protein